MTKKIKYLQYLYHFFIYATVKLPGALRIPKDAIVVNSDGLEIEQTVGKIIDIILEKLVR